MSANNETNPEMEHLDEEGECQLSRQNNDGLVCHYISYLLSDNRNPHLGK
jgi:hypothetical protein